MHYAMLVTVSETPQLIAEFKAIVDSHYPHLSDFVEVRVPYAMIERIPYGTTFQSFKALQNDLECNGFTVWLVTEGNEVIFDKKHGSETGLKKLERFDSLPVT